jgi:transglutaminase-like putative cysteine protease
MRTKRDWAPRVIGAAGAIWATATLAAADPWRGAARYEFEYRVRVATIAPSGARAALWVPYPTENLDQRVVDARVEAPWPWRLTREEKFGNRIVYAEGTPDAHTPDLVMHLTVERHPSTGIPAGVASAEETLRPARYEMPDKLIPFHETIRRLAERESKGRASQSEKARAFYDYVYRTMAYDKDGSGWGRGDAVWACENKRGNCTDFHSLLIGMLRTQGIPGRFVIGFPIPDGDAGPVGGYHCWAEFYDGQRGWLPVDASEAKKKGMADAYYEKIPNDRIEFTAGRDIVLNPPQEGEPLNYFIYPYVEVDGKPVEPPKAAFRFRRLARPTSS